MKTDDAETAAGRALPRVTLIVVYSPEPEECRRFYSGLGLRFTIERHGTGPEHFAAVVADGFVFEIYPSRPGRTTGDLRLGLTVVGTEATPTLPPGRHRMTDPDGRTIEVVSVL